MTQYGRVIAVTVADRIFTNPLRIVANVRLDVGDTSDTGTVELWNLARPTEQHIFNRGDDITVEAGYVGLVGQIFVGQIQEIRRVRKVDGEIARITRIELGDFARRVTDPQRGRGLGGVTARSYNGAVPLRRIVTDLISDAGLRAGPLDVIPASAMVTDFVWTGRSTDALTVLLRRINAGWYEDAGQVRVRNQTTSATAGALRFLVTPDTGLIGTPTPTDDGVEMSMLLNPAIVRGGEIRVESDLLTGDFGVVTVEHQADNWGDRFRTWVDCRPV